MSAGLQAWLNITAGDVANGFAQFVASLAGAQGFGNGPLPLLGRSLTETLGDENGNDIPPLVDALKPLLDYSEQLINATVVCGTVIGDDDPLPDRPHGQPDDRRHASIAAAQTQQPVDARPSSGRFRPDVDATIDRNGDDATTLSQNPTTDAVFKMTAPATSPPSPSGSPAAWRRRPFRVPVARRSSSRGSPLRPA